MPSNDNPDTEPRRQRGAHRTPSRRWLPRPAGQAAPAERPALPPATAASAGRNKQWTAQEVRALGVTTDLQTAAEILGLRPLSGYGIYARRAFPVPVIRVGSRLRVPVAAILDLLCVHRWPGQL